MEEYMEILTFAAKIALSVSTLGIILLELVLGSL